MTNEQFKRAICKGQGRAILHLKGHNPKPYFDDILYACLHNTEYDPQSEDGREAYLFEAVLLSGEPDFFRTAILERVKTETDRRNRSQQLDLVRRFAERGDQEARRILYEVFDRECACEKKPVGGHSIVALDRIDGLLRVTDRLGARALSDPGFEPDFYPYWLSASEIEIHQAVRNGSLQNENVKAYRKWQIESKRQWRKRRRNKQPPRDYSYTEIKSIVDGSAPGPEGISLWLLLRRWARNAPDDQFEQATADYLIEPDAKIRDRFEMIFSNRPLPLPGEELITLAQSDKSDVAETALAALGTFQEPAVRELGIELLGQYRISRAIVELFAQNYRPGDYAFIEAALPDEPDDDTAHNIGHGLHTVFSANQTPECVRPMTWMFGNNPCTNCRNHCLNILIKNGVASQSLLVEASYDANMETREPAAKQLSKS